MGKRILLTFLAIVAAIGGIVSLYFSLLSLNDGGNVFYFLGILLCFGASIYLFMYVTKEKKTDTNLSFGTVTKEEAEEALKKKTQLVKEFGDTNRARTQLQMLEAAGESAQEATK